MRILLRHLAAMSAALSLVLVTAPTSTAVAQKAGVPAGSWEALLAAARREGVVRVSGPRGLPEFQQAVTAQFETEFGVRVDYSGLGAAEVLNRMAGLSPEDVAPWDLFVGGADTLFFNLIDQDLLAPVPPQLVRPDVIDPAKWQGGALPALDSDGRVIAFLRQAGQYFYVDTSRVDPASISTYRDLLAPMWKGQILLTADPRAPGHARSAFSLFYASPGLGPDFIRTLIAQQSLVIAPDDASAQDLLFSGTYLMCVCNNAQGTELHDRGMPYQAIDPHGIKEGSNATSSFANLALPRHPPHPNASMLYANWILTSEAGFQASLATNLPSLRDDVPKDFLPRASVPAPGWPIANDQAGLRAADETVRLLMQIMGPLT